MKGRSQCQEMADTVNWECPSACATGMTIPGHCSYSSLVMTPCLVMLASGHCIYNRQTVFPTCQSIKEEYQLWCDPDMEQKDDELQRRGLKIEMSQATRWSRQGHCWSLSLVLTVDKAYFILSIPGSNFNTMKPPTTTVSTKFASLSVPPSSCVSSCYV